MTKVLFNIKKLQMSPITAMTADGLPTYASPIKVPGHSFFETGSGR